MLKRFNYDQINSVFLYPKQKKNSPRIPIVLKPVPYFVGNDTEDGTFFAASGGVFLPKRKRGETFTVHFILRSKIDF